MTVTIQNYYKLLVYVLPGCIIASLFEGYGIAEE